LTKQDGTTLPLHSRELRPTAPGESTAASIFGAWVPQSAGFYGLARALAGWPFTDAARAAKAAGADALRVAHDRWVPFGLPGTMVVQNLISVADGGSTITFKGDYMNVERIVHLDVAARPAGVPPTVFGYSIGRWDGATLVVDTTGFTPQAEGYGFE